MTTVVGDLRRARQQRRVGEVEWFDIAYKVYLAGLGGGLGVLLIGDAVGDGIPSATRLEQVTQHGPSLIGLVAACFLLASLRTGLAGGPLAIEPADARFLFEAPIARRDVLRRPAVQRLRAAAFAGGLVGAIAGQFAARVLPGTIPRWSLGAALAGATVGWAGVAVALLAHAARRRWIEGAGLALVVVQALALLTVIPAGPLDPIGSLALWGWRVHPGDVAAVVVAAALTWPALHTLERQRAERMIRRSALVAQLRFAATMQDLRTVTLLRRQLSHEQHRVRPLFRVPRWGSPMWRRGWHSIARFPARRFARMAALSAAAGAAHVLIVRGVTPMVAVAAVCTFVLGLEAIEPLAQAIDHPELSDSCPLGAGVLYRGLVHPSLVLLVVMALPGIVVGAIWSGSIMVPVIIAVPAVLIGGMGAVSNAHQSVAPSVRQPQSPMMPPEMAGATHVVKTLWPPLIAAIGTVPTLFARHADRNGGKVINAAARGGVGVLAVVALLLWWIVRRAQFSTWLRSTVNEGRREAGLGPLT